MRPFSYVRAPDEESAIHLVSEPSHELPPTLSPFQFLAGGTNIVDFMKLSCWTTDGLVDINDLQVQHGKIESRSEGLHLGALVRMSQAADDESVRRDYPVIAESLALAASAQIRNMASLGGNVLQRTRCGYFRNIDYMQCNKRDPGSGCAALKGNNRGHAVLGVSEHCISTYPGDFAQALIALDAEVLIANRRGRKKLRFRDLHTDSSHPEKETVLAPDDLITGYFIPAGPHTRRSAYVKIRDRQSYQFGLATAAVAMDLSPGNVVRDLRIGLGGVAYKPWRAVEAESWLRGKVLDEEAANETGRIALAGAVPHGDNDYKPELGAQTVARALLQVQAMEV